MLKKLLLTRNIEPAIDSETPSVAVNEAIQVYPLVDEAL